jgi:hypothetical protein
MDATETMQHLKLPEMHSDNSLKSKAAVTAYVAGVAYDSFANASSFLRSINSELRLFFLPCQYHIRPCFYNTRQTFPECKVRVSQYVNDLTNLCTYRSSLRNWILKIYQNDSQQPSYKSCIWHIHTVVHVFPPMKMSWVRSRKEKKECWSIIVNVVKEHQRGFGWSNKPWRRVYRIQQGYGASCNMQLHRLSAESALDQ